MKTNLSLFLLGALRKLIRGLRSAATHTAATAVLVGTLCFLTAKPVHAESNLESLDARLARVEELLTLMATSPASSISEQKDVAAAVQRMRAQVDAARAAKPAGESSTKTSFRFYGYAKWDAAYDTQKTSSGDLMFFVLPTVNGRSDNEFNMTVRETRLGFCIDRPSTGGTGKLEGKVEMDFNGGGAPNSLTPRLRLAYADFTVGAWSVRAGQDWDAFVTVIPKSLNFAVFGDQGQIGNRRPLIRVTRKWNEFELRVAAARTIGQDIDGCGQDDGVDSGVPTIEWNALWSRATARGTYKASVSGHLGHESVEYPVSGLHKDYLSWSVIGSVVAPLTRELQLQGTVWQGSNLDCYLGGIGQGINPVLGRSIDGKGGWVQALFTPSSIWVLHATAGLDDPDDGDLSNGQRTLNQVISSGAWYEFRPSMKLAFELSRMRTGYKAAPAAANTRIQSGLILEF